MSRKSTWVEFEETYAMERANISRAIRVFMSYHREDTDVARRIAADLTARGLEVWLDLASMPGGANFREEITKAIDRTLENGAMVVLVLRRSMESN
jgi:hypothetical protein